MKIIKYKKMSKGRYKVTFDENELILYENVIINNDLLTRKNINLELLEKIIEENKYYEVYDIALTLIEIKMRTESELVSSLEKKGFDLNIIKDVIERLKNEGYINEKKYIEAYINDKINLTTMGPFKIKRNLMELELDEYLIDEYLDKIPYDIWEDKLKSLIDKRIKLMKNKSLYIIKNKLKIDLFNLGYQNDLIDKLLNNLEKNDNDIIEKEYTKAYNKYSKKYDGNMLKAQIKNHLYKKGFNINDIENVINR